VADPLPNYFALFSGLTKATRARARAAAQSLVTQAGLDGVAADANELVAKLTEEITGASRANRELLENLVATEVDKAAARLGFSRSEDLAAMRVELTLMGARVALLESRSPAETAPAKKVPTKKAPAATTAPTKKTTAKKTPAKKTPAKKSTAENATPAEAPSS
jgi:hypothetical protein